MSKINIRNVKMDELDIVANIESLCFPVEEAATKDKMKERLDVYRKGFFVCEYDGEIVGFINGGAFDEDTIRDEFFESMDEHGDEKKNLMIFGLDVHPEYQGKSLGRHLMNKYIEFGKAENKESILLTCKEHLIDYYSSFGYKNLGVSSSVHGGAKWYDMVLEL